MSTISFAARLFIFTMIPADAEQAASGFLEANVACPAEYPQASRCADVPLDIVLTVDEAQITPGATVAIAARVTARAPLRILRGESVATGTARTVERLGDLPDTLGLGAELNLSIPVEFLGQGLSSVSVEVRVETAGGFAFAKRATLNVLLLPDGAITGEEHPVDLRVKALERDLNAGRSTREEYAAQLAELLRPDGAFDTAPAAWMKAGGERPASVEGPPPVDTGEAAMGVAVAEGGQLRGGVTFRVMGNVRWFGDDSFTHGAYGVTVQVRDDDTVGSELVWSATTDGFGNYDTGWITHDDGVGAGNPDIFVRFILANGLIDVRDDCFLCQTYSNDTPVINEFSGGTITQNFTYAATGTGPAASVLTGLSWIALYAHDLNGGAWLSSVYAYWPGDPASSNYWCGSSCRINVQPGDAFDWDVLHHEYGHKVMDDFGFDNNPGGAHNIDACHSVVRSSKDVGIRLAWGEGWPTFFGTAGQRALNMAALLVPRVGDVDYTETVEANFTYSLEENSGGPPWSAVDGSGEDNELAVQRLLWDLYDTGNDSRDAVSESDEWLFWAMSNPHKGDLSSTWGAITPSLTWQEQRTWSAILTDHNIGPTPLAPAGGSIVTPSSATFFWDANVGCDAAFAGDSFELNFYNPATFVPVLSIPSSNIVGTSHTLTPGEFQALVSAGHDVLWSVTGWNIDSPLTGPYRGDSLLIHVYVPPGNDSCSSAMPIGDGSWSGTTLGATTDGNDTCTINSGPDVWYAYQATCDGFLNVDTCGSGFDTVVSLHDGCPGNFLNEYACNRNCDGGPCGLGNSCLTGTAVRVTQGEALLIRVAGVPGSQGDFPLHVSCDAQHDSCDDAGALVNGEDDLGTTSGAAWDNAPTCDGFANTAGGVWYTVIGNGNLLTASLCDDATNYDSQLTVYCGGCGGLQCRGASDDACGRASEVSWCSAPGAVYHVLIHGYQQNEGEFRLTISDGAYCGPLYLNCAPANDDCARATEIGMGSFTADNTSATTDGAVTCAASSHDVWFRYVPVCFGFVAISTCGAGGSLSDTVLSVHDGCSGRQIACNDDFAACGARSHMTVPVEADRPILIRAASYGGAAQGTFPLSLTMSGTLAPLVVPPPGLYVTGGGGRAEDHLLRIDGDGALVDVGPLGAAGVSALAYAQKLGLMYGVNDIVDTDETVTVNWQTGAATAVGAVGFSAVQALAFDPDKLVLYGADLSTGNLVRVDPFTGAGSSVGPIGYSSVTGLAYDSSSGVLYGADNATDQLILISTSNGAGVAVGGFGGGLGNVQDIALDPVSGVLYGVQNDDGSGRLLTINAATGAATVIGGPYANLDPAGLTVVPGLPDGAVGEPYGAYIPIGGGCPRYYVGEVASVPPGLSVSGDGFVAGTPTAGGAYVVSVTIEDSNLSTPYISATLPVRIHPRGDDCENAIVADEGSTPFDMRGGMTDGPAEPGVCDFFGDTQVGSDIWFCHSSECDGRLTFSLCGSGYDTKLAVYEGCACPQEAAAIACSDDDCGAQSMVTFSVVPGSATSSASAGTTGPRAGTLTISCAECTTGAECDDGNGCTTDGCSSGRCRHVYQSCDDDDACTLDDCQASAGCTHMDVDCADDDPCTLDGCDPLSGCTHMPITCGGACCMAGTCIDNVDAEDCIGFRCNVGEHLPPSFAGCYGDADGNGVVNPGDRGFIAANIGQTDAVLMCKYDLDGNGVINPGDRGFVAANIGLCTPLPDWQNGSGLNHGVPDPRFPAAVFMGAGSTCGSTVCP